MPNKNRVHVPADASGELTMVPKHKTKQAFGTRLYRVMLAKGWSQSELARRSGLPRDSISTYMRGKCLPTPLSLLKLAGALEVTAADLMPDAVEGAADEVAPAFEMRQSPHDPARAWLRVNRLVSMETALKIAELLSNDNALSDGN